MFALNISISGINLIYLLSILKLVSVGLHCITLLQTDWFSVYIRSFFTQQNLIYTVCIYQSRYYNLLNVLVHKIFTLGNLVKIDLSWRYLQCFSYEEALRVSVCEYVCISVFVSVSTTWPSQTHYMHKLKQASPLGYFVIAFSSALIKFSIHDKYKWSALKPSREILCKTTVNPAR